MYDHGVYGQASSGAHALWARLNQSIRAISILL